MPLTKLNPVIRSVSLYERINRTDECIGYDSRVIYIVSGDLTATVGGEKLGHIGAGQLLYIPAGTPYKLKGQYLRAVVITFDPTDENPEPKEKIPPVPVADFKPEVCHRVGNLPPFDNVLTLSGMEGERDGLLRMCDIFTSAEGYYRQQLSAMVKLLLLKIAEANDEHALPARMVESLDSYIRENVGEEISNTELGAIFGYHPFYISKLLKEKKGQTLHQYIISYRFKLAKSKLETSGESINEIAAECGFSDPSYFTKAFKASFGMTPKEYRNKYKEEFI